MTTPDLPPPAVIDVNVGDLFTRDQVLAAIAPYKAEIAKAREILAGSDYGALPNDWTLPQIAEARMDDIYKLTWQVRDTCARAEQAEAALAAERERSEQDRKDAERYRVLHGDIRTTFSPIVHPPFKPDVGYSPEGLDRVCDEAIAAAIRARGTP